jgi:TRAP-type uncharacterized transport system fused permease subunit
MAAPAVAVLGVEQLVTHFFVFFYGVLADITPPVAVAAYAAVGIAGANPFKAGNTAFKLGNAKPLVPIVFVYAPSLLIVTQGFTWSEFVVALSGCVLRILFLGGALTGYLLADLPRWQSWLLGFGSVCTGHSIRDRRPCAVRAGAGHAVASVAGAACRRRRGRCAGGGFIRVNA